MRFESSQAQSSRQLRTESDEVLDLLRQETGDHPQCGAWNDSFSKIVFNPPKEKESYVQESFCTKNNLNLTFADETQPEDSMGAAGKRIPFESEANSSNGHKQTDLLNESEVLRPLLEPNLPEESIEGLNDIISQLDSAKLKVPYNVAHRKALEDDIFFEAVQSVMIPK